MDRFDGRGVKHFGYRTRELRPTDVETVTGVAISDVRREHAHATTKSSPTLCRISRVLRHLCGWVPSGDIAEPWPRPRISILSPLSPGSEESPQEQPIYLLLAMGRLVRTNGLIGP